MQTDRIARRYDCTGDDVVAIQQAASNGFSDTVNIYGWCCDECNDETSCSGEQGWDHKRPEPANIKSVVSAGDPLGKIVPTGLPGP